MLIIDYFCCKSKKYNLHCHHFFQKKRMMSKNIYFQMKKQAKKHLKIEKKCRKGTLSGILRFCAPDAPAKTQRFGKMLLASGVGTAASGEDLH